MYTFLITACIEHCVTSARRIKVYQRQKLKLWPHCRNALWGLGGREAVPVMQHLMFTADGQISRTRHTRITWQILWLCLFHWPRTQERVPLFLSVTDPDCTLCEDSHKAAIITHNLCKNHQSGELSGVFIVSCQLWYDASRFPLGLLYRQCNYSSLIIHMVS